MLDYAEYIFKNIKEKRLISFVRPSNKQINTKTEMKWRQLKKFPHIKRHPHLNP